MLKIEGLSVSYGQRRVLHGISLEVNSGEVVALIGPNGAGKSTLVRAVSGVIPVEGGSIRTNSSDLLSLSPMMRARHLAVVPQAVSMPPAFTVWETVLLGRTPYLNFLGQVSVKDEQIARAALARVDALDLSERRVGELSGGEQQRVLLARALAQSTPILLMDEPTAHLDLQHQVALMEMAQELAHADPLTGTGGLAVLAALHDLNLAARYADRLALLVSGEIKAQGTAQQVLSPEAIAAAYGLPVDVIPHPFAEDVPLVLPLGKPK
ncbi:MAG: ABC transporter ATP-binding protein [Chloroflexi bacterium]|nr:ABC transporter ATP-binding protein [Chloroflexota bacterium]